MNKKLSLMLLVTASLNFVPSHATGTRKGTKTSRTRSGKIFRETAPAQAVVLPLRVIVPPVTRLPLEGETVAITTPIFADLNTEFSTPDKTDTPVETPVVAIDASGTKADPIVIEEKAAVKAKVAEQSTKVLVLTGLKAFASGISDRFNSIFA